MRPRSSNNDLRSRPRISPRWTWLALALLGCNGIAGIDTPKHRNAAGEGEGGAPCAGYTCGGCERPGACAPATDAETSAGSGAGGSAGVAGTGAVGASTATSSASGAGGTTGATTGSGGPVAVFGCRPGSIDAFQETFSGPTLDPGLWQEGDDGASFLGVLGGELVIRPAQRYTWTYVATNPTFSLVDCQVTARVTSYLNPATSAYLHMTVTVGPNAVEFVKSGPNLDIRHNVGNGSILLASGSYSPTAHAFWRLRETSGFIYWELSADGIAWTVVFRELDPLPFDQVKLMFGSGAFDSEGPQVGEAHFDDVNVLPHAP